MADSTMKKSSPALVALAWVVVVVPATWGLTYTVQNALKLFTTAKAPVTGAPPVAAPAVTPAK